MPITIVMPSSRVRRSTEEPKAPSDGSAISASGAPKACMAASGLTARQAPAVAAVRAVSVIFARFASMSWLLSICTSATRTGPSSVLGASRCRRSNLHRVLQPQRPLDTCAHGRRELLAETEGSLKKGHGAAEDDQVAGRILLGCARYEIALHSQLGQ